MELFKMTPFFGDKTATLVLTGRTVVYCVVLVKDNGCQGEKGPT